jgi:hypothetical protein
VRYDILISKVTKTSRKRNRKKNLEAKLKEIAPGDLSRCEKQPLLVALTPSRVARDGLVATYWHVRLTLGVSGALYLSVFEQPENRTFFRSPVVERRNASEGGG